ncbi:unnamed protein product [Alopecurus aequalis]
MAASKFYSVPEINPTTPPYEVFGSLLQARISMEAGVWAGEQLVDLARRRPEDGPACFLAVQADELSPLTGWVTEHGKWEPKKMFAAGPGLGKIIADLVTYALYGWTRTSLVFRPKDGSESDLAMTMYNELRRNNNKEYLQVDHTFCHVFRDPKQKGKDKREALAISHWRSLFGHYVPSNVSDYLNDLGGPNKRSKPNPDGKSDVWNTFTKIYIEGSDVEYAACHHCGRMMKLTGGSGCGTNSLLTHLKTCKFKPVRSTDAIYAEFESLVN